MNNPQLTPQFRDFIAINNSTKLLHYTSIACKTDISVNVCEFHCFYLGLMKYLVQIHINQVYSVSGNSEIYSYFFPPQKYSFS
jgi:hypothetical protein